MASPSPNPALVFIDIEASSLRKGFPVEVAWCAANLERAATYLIRPEPGWLDQYDWSAEAESMHGITRDLLEAQGLGAAEVAERLAEDLDGADVGSNNPAFDGGWLTVLYGGDPPFGLREIRPAGVASLSSDIDLRAHRALDDAVALAMAFKAFETDHHRLHADQAEARARDLLKRLGRR